MTPKEFWIQAFLSSISCTSWIIDEAGGVEPEEIVKASADLADAAVAEALRRGAIEPDQAQVVDRYAFGNK